MRNQRSVFEFGNEYQCTEFYDVDLGYGGVDVSVDDEHLGQIVGISIPDFDDEDECEKFDNEVIEWIVDNGY